MNTEYIEKIFTDYIDTKQTQYALLLNGEWGCGKTFFWKTILDDVAKKHKLKTIYISLNGISKIEALEHLLFIKLLPIISNQENTAIKNATTFVGNVLNKLSNHYMKTSLSDIFKGISVDSYSFSEHIICFDDLERCQIPVKEVLGFINNFVEHKGLKTIILADETNIDTSQKGYNNIKEKVIGRVLNFELNIASTLPQLFEKYKENNKDFYDFLNSKKGTLIDILVEYKQNNLRIINFYLDLLEKMSPAFKEVDVKYVNEVILFSALIAIEFKKGDLTSSDYKNFKDLDVVNEYYYNFSALTETKTELEENKSYARKFYEKYLTKRISEYHFYSSIYAYVLSGYLNFTQLESEIKNRSEEIITKEIQSFRTLFNYKFRELSNEEFHNLTKDVIQYAKEGKYSIYDYSTIAEFLYYFSKNKLISETKEGVDKILMEGLEIAKSRKEINDRLMENYLHFGNENPDVVKIMQVVKSIHDEIKKEGYKANAKEFIECLANKDENTLAELFEKYKFSNELFQYIDDKEFFETILKVSNKQVFNFTELLRPRYNSSNIGEFLYEDIDCLTKLNNRLGNYLTENQNNIQEPRKFLLCTLETTLLLIIEKLNNTKKQNQ